MLNHVYMVLWMLILVSLSAFVFSSKKFSIIDKVDKRDLNNIDALRGILALMVVFHHYMYNYFLWKKGDWTIDGYNVFLSIGPFAVCVFFILSGYLFSSTGTKNTDQWLSFYKKRIFRIIPVCLVSSLLCITISYILGHKSFSELSSIAYWLDGGVFNLRPDLFGFSGSNLINAGVTWTLHWEWLLYASLPFISIIVPKKSMLTVSLIVAALSIPSYIAVKLSTHNVELANSFKYILCFSFGYISRYLNNTRVIQLLTSRKSLSFILLVTAAIFVAGKGYSFYTSILAFLIFFNVLNGFSFFGILQNSGLRRIGVVSYSIYLIHGVCWFTCFQFMTEKTNILLASTLTFLVVIILSTIISLMIEYPCYNIVKRPKKVTSNEISPDNKLA
ncbi:acyltransferase [Tatumella sp. OPLPL6]|uniref:acyltransferase family protein n=1 Tax=Tatumella sp. OPLPL6 TaxID=1928657 RepID=UPI000C17E50B|nr:acyltransferase [Tatumella sp. OPLPL6]PIJ42671.1 hypothetical protein BOM24_11300 [Tatumella sp. OPLPL6]